MSHKVNVGGIQNLFVAKCLSKLEANKENVNHAEVSKDSPVTGAIQVSNKIYNEHGGLVSMTILVREGKLPVTGKQFAQWCLEKGHQ